MKHQSIVFGRVLLKLYICFHSVSTEQYVILVNFEAEARAACNWGCIVRSQSSAVIVNLAEELYTAYCSVFDSQESFFFFLPVPECIWCLASFLSVAICVQSNLCFLLSGKMLCVCVHMCACTSESVNTLCFNLRLSLSFSLACLIVNFLPNVYCPKAQSSECFLV